MAADWVDDLCPWPTEPTSNPHYHCSAASSEPCPTGEHVNPHPANTARGGEQHGITFLQAREYRASGKDVFTPRGDAGVISRLTTRGADGPEAYVHTSIGADDPSGWYALSDLTIIVQEG